MTHVTPRRIGSTGRRLARVAIAAAAVLTVVAGFSFGYDLWRFLVSALLVAMLAVLIVVLVVSLRGAFRWDEQ